MRCEASQQAHKLMMSATSHGGHEHRAKLSQMRCSSKLLRIQNAHQPPQAMQMAASYHKKQLAARYCHRDKMLTTVTTRYRDETLTTCRTLNW